MEKLSDDQVEEYTDAFRLFDRDGNGYITTNELCQIMRTLGFNPTEDELQDMIFNVDYDEDGMLNLKEFIDLMENFKKPEEEEDDVVQAFRVFDPDETGYVDADELREALGHSEVKVNQADMADLLHFYGLQEGRKIDFDEFSTLVEPNQAPQK